LLALLTVTGSVFLYVAATGPHGPIPRHPPEVARIMKLLPEIPASASHDEIIAFLGLPEEWDGGSFDVHLCTMVWEHIAPGYKFVLCFHPEPRGGKLTLLFVEASFSAQSMLCCSPDGRGTVYPYRTWKGMVYHGW